MTEFEKRVEARAAFDRRDPDPKKDYGVHGVEFYFALIGPEGAVTFTLYTGWLLPKTLGVEAASWQYGKALVERESYPMPAQISYHSPVQLHDYETGAEKCEWIGGVPCYGDGTFLADDAFMALVEGGTDGLWKFLEGWYESRLEGRDGGVDRDDQG